MLEMSVDFLDSSSEAGVSKEQVVLNSILPVFSGSSAHNLLESRVHDVDLLGAGEVLHVRRVGRNSVAHRLEKLHVLFFLVLFGHAAGGNVLEVLQPLEVGASDTSTIGKHVGDDNDTLFFKDFFSHVGGRSIGTFKNNFALKFMSVILVDGFFFCSRYQKVAGLFHEFCRIDGCDFISFRVVSESSVLDHVVANIIDIKAISIIDSGVVLNYTYNLTSVLSKEFSSPVSDSTESLHNEGLILDSFSSETSSLDE